MRTISAQETAVLLRAKYQVQTRVSVDDGTTTFRDLSTLVGFDWIKSVDIQEDINTPVAKATVVLEREAYLFSLSGFIAASKLNNLTGGYLALIAVNRQIKIETATIPLEAVPQSTDWHLVFNGYIDTVDIGADFQITLACRDLGSKLQDAVTEMTRGYCGVGTNIDSTAWAPNAPSSAETVIQQILNDTAAGGSPTLNTPVSPGWTVYGGFATAGQPAGFKVEKGTNVLDAVRNVATQIGWEVRYLWDTGSSTYKLTLYQPTRTGPAILYTFGKDQYFSVQKMAQDRTQVRNVIEVIFNDPNVLGPDGVDVATPTPVIVSDAPSIAKYGRRFMSVQEASTSQIDTSAVATSMANALLSDLKDPVLDSLIEMPFFFPVVLGDYYKFTANGVHFDQDQSLAVVSFKHSISKDHNRTVLGVRGVPSSSASDWYARMATWGFGLKTDDTPGQQPTIANSSSIMGGVYIGGNTHSGSVGPIPNPNIQKWKHTELHLSTTNGFTPGPSTLVALGRQSNFMIHGLVVGTTYYAKIINVDMRGNRTAASPQVVVVPRAATLHELGDFLQQSFKAYISTAAVVPGATGTVVPYDTVDWDNNSNFAVGPHRFTAQTTGKYRFSAQVRIDGTGAAMGTCVAYLSLHVNAAAGASLKAQPQLPTAQVPAVGGSVTGCPFLDASLSLTAGDTVEVRLNYNTAGAYAGLAYTNTKLDTWFSGFKEGTN